MSSSSPMSAASSGASLSLALSDLVTIGNSSLSNLRSFAQFSGKGQRLDRRPRIAERGPWTVGAATLSEIQRSDRIFFENEIVNFGLECRLLEMLDPAIPRNQE